MRPATSTSIGNGADSRIVSRWMPVGTYRPLTASISYVKTTARPALSSSTRQKCLIPASAYSWGLRKVSRASDSGERYVASDTYSALVTFW